MNAIRTKGRKALLFSDGRQKAARLARDLPREVERDSLREALIAALKELCGHWERARSRRYTLCCVCSGLRAPSSAFL